MKLDTCEQAVDPSALEAESLNSPNPPLVGAGDSAALFMTVLVLSALVLRGWNFFLLGLDHYDEGVYAFSGFWSLHSYAGHALYPFQKLIAPPGYFGLIGLAYRLVGGPSDSAAIAIDMIFGTASAWLAWCVGSRWFGRTCGIAAATLVALSDFNIAFDRTALTDTVFAFLLLSSLALIAVALEKESLRWALLAGLAAGVAWNVKYDGWLAPGIAFVAVVLLAIARPSLRPGVKRTLLLCCVIAGVSAILFLPWVIYTQEKLGGFMAVEAFHRTFLNFLWRENFGAQARSLLYFDGFLTRISPMAACVIALLVDGGRALGRWRVVAVVLGGILISSFILGGIGTCIALAALGLPAAWRNGKILGPLLVTGAMLLFVAIPCYTVYARLLLPWLLFVYILAAVGIQSILVAAESHDLGDRDEGSVRNMQRSGLLCLAGIAIAAVLASHSATTNVDPWNSARTDSVRQAVAAMKQIIPAGSVVFVEAEPDAAFYFRRAGYETFGVEHLLNNPGVPTPFSYSTESPVYLVAGIYAQRQADWHAVPPEVANRMLPLAQATIRPGDVRLLDDLNPQDVAEHRRHPDDTYNLILLRITSTIKGDAVVNPPVKIP